MCGRYTLKASPEVLQAVFDLAHVPEAMGQRYNIAPTQAAAVIVNRDVAPSEREIEAFRWGLVPSWARDRSIASRLINARSETVASKPSFRSALRKRRCLVLADGFYEWRKAGKERIPHWIHLDDEAPFAMAGLWERWRQSPDEVLHTFTIITTDANEAVAPIHKRMPVILPAESWSDWLAPGEVRADAVQSLLAPAPPEGFQHRIVSKLVNAVRNDSAACLEPPTGTLL